MGLPTDSSMSSLDKDALIKSADMPEAMKQEAVEIAKDVRCFGFWFVLSGYRPFWRILWKKTLQRL